MDYEEKRLRGRRAEKKYRASLSPEKKAAFIAKWSAHRANQSPEKKAARNAKRREGHVRIADLSETERKQKRERGKVATRKYVANLPPEKKEVLRVKQNEKQHAPEWRAYKNQWEKNRYANDEDRRQKILARKKKERSHISWRYGLKKGAYAEMLTTQDGQCAICGRTDSGRKGSTYLQIDHCHKTRKIRGLLCAACNLGLAKFYDDPNLLRKAALYLEQSVG